MLPQGAVSYGTAIVTGGGYGIGRAACRMLAADGWSIMVVDRDEGRAAETVSLVRAAGGLAQPVVGDVTYPATADAAVRAANESFGKVTGLVTCAALRHVGRITDTTAEQWDETLRVILYGAFNFCKAVLPEMIAAGGGTIVNVSSPDAFGRRGMVAYSVAKAAVNALTTCLAADHVGDHIRVNTVLPGFTVTGMTEHYPAERLQNAGLASVAGRPGAPEDAARLIAFLMSKAGETFTGGMFGNLPLAGNR